MSVDSELYDYLIAAIPSAKIYRATRPVSETPDDSVVITRLPSSTDLYNPITEVQYQLSVRARYVDGARDLVDALIDSLRGLYDMGDYHFRVLSIQQLGDLVEENYTHIPLIVTGQVVR